MQAWYAKVTHGTMIADNVAGNRCTKMSACALLCSAGSLLPARI